MPEVQITFREVARVVVAQQLRSVMAFERRSDFLEKLHEFGGGLIGQIDNCQMGQARIIPERILSRVAHAIA